MPIDHIADHRDRGLGLLITQHWEKPRLAALISAFLDEVQLLEDATWGVITGRMVDDAVGAQLDTIGSIVGQPRVGDDEEFRLYIKARIAVNSSDGTGDDVMHVASALLEGKPWTYEETYPASIIIETYSAARAATVSQLLRLTRSGGVGLGYHYSEGPSGAALILDTPSGLADDNGAGGGALLGAY